MTAQPFTAGSCDYCGNSYVLEPGAAANGVCSGRCATQRRRRGRRQRHCPTPTKRGYAKQADAARAVTEVSGRYAKVGRSPSLRPYHCQCGQWHLTQFTKKQLSAALARRAAGFTSPAPYHRVPKGGTP